MATTKAKCAWKNGRVCTMCGYLVTKSDCEECSDFKAPEEEIETVKEHLAKMDAAECAELICSKVEECHGWPNRLALWLRSEWEDSNGTI